MDSFVSVKLRHSFRVWVLSYKNAKQQSEYQERAVVHYNSNVVQTCLQAWTFYMKQQHRLKVDYL